MQVFAGICIKYDVSGFYFGMKTANDNVMVKPDILLLNTCRLDTSVL